MAIFKSHNTNLITGLKACNDLFHNVWGVNFNMPVPDLFTGSCSLANGFLCACFGANCATYNASLMCPGFEALENVSIFQWCVTSGDSLNGIAEGCVVWKRGTDIVSSNATGNLCVDISGDGQWQFFQFHYMTGFDSDEVCITCGYGTDVEACCISGDDVSIGGSTQATCICNVPSTSRCAANLRGFTWVEGNNLHFINANCWEHSMAGDDQGATSAGKEGFMWIDLSHYLHWVGADCHDYRTKWRICQFDSCFSPGPGGNPAPGAALAGNLWLDDEYGQTHLGYIGCDGNKYITGAGDDPDGTPACT